MDFIVIWLGKSGVLGPEPQGANTTHRRLQPGFALQFRVTNDAVMIAVQPPAYFPPLSYTALLHHVDHFILADTFRFRRQSFQDCSKLRNAQGWHWITVPLFGQPEGAPLLEVEIETGGRWREKHWRSFMYDYRTTMYFEYFEDRFRPFFDEKWEGLSSCTCRSVKLQADLFGLDTSITRASTLSGAPDTYEAIVEATGADAVAAPAPEDVTVASARVETFEYEHPTYRQNFEGFEAGMTGMDLLFNYGREAPKILAKGIQAVD